MRVPQYFAILLLALGSAGAADTNPLIGSWRLDAEATAAYLREHKILPEVAIQRLFALQHSVAWRFDDKSVYGTAHEMGKSMPYRIAMRSGLKLKLVTTDEATGKTYTSMIVMDEDGKGYWQETEFVKGYRERIVRETHEPDKPTQHRAGDGPVSNDSPDSATPTAPAPRG